jgi:hypothetical protein
MSSATDALNSPRPPNRVFYSLGRMLGAEDFQADQDYHRGRLARAILQVCGTGTVSGLKVLLSQYWLPKKPYATWAYVVDSKENVHVNLGSGGASGDAEPAWGGAKGSRSPDGSVTWTNQGPIIESGWRPNANFTPPSVIVDSNGNLQVLADASPLETGSAVPMWSSIPGGATADGNSAAAWMCIGSKELEVQVTPGIAIDRVGRIVEIPRTVCIRVKQWLASQPASSLNQAFKQTTATPSPAYAIIADVFTTFAGCTRGVTPCFATQDDYDATDAFSPNRLLDSFAMQLVLRPDVEFMTTPQRLMLPEDPWAELGPTSTPPTPSAATLQQRLLDATTGPAALDPLSEEKVPNEIPIGSGLDPSSIFLARVQIPATAGTGGAPEPNLSAITIDNFSRLFLYPASLVARWIGLTSGTQS